MNCNTKFEQDLYISPDQFEIVHNDASLSDALCCYQKQIKSKMFNNSGMKRASLTQCHAEKYGKVSDAIKSGKKKCKCKFGNCKKSCGCFELKRCNIHCSCRGLCRIGNITEDKCCTCEDGYCNKNQCGCKKSTLPCTKSCTCKGKCKVLKVKKPVTPFCRCKKIVEGKVVCGKSCSCKGPDRKCSLKCYCNGKCVSLNMIIHPPVSMTLCHPTTITKPSSVSTSNITNQSQTNASQTNASHQNINGIADALMSLRNTTSKEDTNTQPKECIIGSNISKSSICELGKKINNRKRKLSHNATDLSLQF